MQAAVIVNSLPAQQAAKVLARLQSRDIRAVMDAITRLDDVSASQISQAMERLSSDSLRWKSLNAPGNSDAVQEAQRQINAALKLPRSENDKAIESSNPFSFLLDTIPMVRTHLLADEHPKSIAIVLSTFPAEIASETMKGLDPSLRFSVLKRLCEIEELDEAEVAELSFAIKLRFKKLLKSRNAKSAGLGKAADLLSCSDPDMRESLMAYVGQADPDLAFKLQRKVFGIERLETLTNGEIKTILKNVDTSCWAPALKNSPESLVTKILSNMAIEAATILKHEIAEIGYIEQGVEDLARQNIIQVVMGLARAGKVELRKNGPRKPRQSFPQVGRPSLDATSPISLTDI